MTATPTRAADELIYHLSTCPQCKRAEDGKRRRKVCPIGRDLIKQTLKERHGA